MIVIFDTFSGLCNQFFDILHGVNFCIVNNIKFSFRYCSFRSPDHLLIFYNMDFDKLFDLSIICKKYEHLYVDFSKLQLTPDNTYNWGETRAVNLFSNNYINEIKNISKEYVILKQFWTICIGNDTIVDNLFNRILPSKRLMEIYERIKSNLLENDEEYNFIHYRYEWDFASCFNIEIESLEDIILRIKEQFKNPDLRIYIAGGNINKIIDLNNSKFSEIIFFKNEDELIDYNYEEKAFIDFMFGLKSNQLYGHSKSSFSHVLNNIKGTSNFYS